VEDEVRTQEHAHRTEHDAGDGHTELTLQPARTPDVGLGRESEGQGDYRDDSAR
jgi:hypothetical protein